MKKDKIIHLAAAVIWAGCLIALAWHDVEIIVTNDNLKISF